MKNKRIGKRLFRLMAAALSVVLIVGSMTACGQREVLPEDVRNKTEENSMADARNKTEEKSTENTGAGPRWKYGYGHRYPFLRIRPV